MDDFLLLKELYRYTHIARNCEKKSEITINKEILGVDKLNVSNLQRVTEFNDIYLLNIDIELINDTDYDEFTLYNVIQLNDEFNYKMMEYIEKNKLDRYNTIINHDNRNISMDNLLMYDDIFNDFSDEKEINDLIKLYSGIFRIHIAPSKLVFHFSKRYWHHWDNDFKIIQ